MKTLTSIVVSLALGYSALGCGPEGVTNNYYGAGKGGSGASGNFGSYTCDDVFANARSCYLAMGEDPEELTRFNILDDFDLSEKICQNPSQKQKACIDCLAGVSCSFTECYAKMGGANLCGDE